MADNRAHAAAAKAILAGTLKRPIDLTCVDCDGAAAVYDHVRGYARERRLDVEPVCIGCKAKRAWKDRGLSTSELSAVLVRIPTWLVNELDADVRASGRSRNAHLVWLLQRAYPDAAARHPERVIRSRGLRIGEDAVIYNA